MQFIFITSEGESPEKPYKEYVEKNLKGEAVYRIPSSDYQRLRELFSFNGIPRYILVGRDGKSFRMIICIFISLKHWRRI